MIEVLSLNEKVRLQWEQPFTQDLLLFALRLGELEVSRNLMCVGKDDCNEKGLRKWYRSR